MALHEPLQSPLEAGFLARYFLGLNSSGYYTSEYRLSGSGYQRPL